MKNVFKSFNIFQKLIAQFIDFIKTFNYICNRKENTELSNYPVLQRFLHKDNDYKLTPHPNYCINLDT